MVLKPEFQGRRKLKVTNIIEGMNVLEQTPIKDYTALSNIFMVIGFGIAIVATIIFFIKTKSKLIRLKDLGTKIFLFFYIFGLGVVLFAMIRFPWFYVETGRYTYECTFDESVSANSIDEKFNILSVEDGIWTVEDKY